MYKFAVVLSGAGNMDGSEIHESVCTLLALDEAGIAYQCFAPSVAQARTVNHFSKEDKSEGRNALEESARIARSNVKNLTEFNAQDYDGIIIPGGLGAAFTLSTFARLGSNCSVQPDLESAIIEAYNHKKIIGALCIAPVILAKVLGGYKVKLTIGNDEGVAAKIEEMGAEHQTRSSTETCVDVDNRVVTVPCYMLDKSITQIYQSCKNLVKDCQNLLVA